MPVRLDEISDSMINVLPRPEETTPGVRRLDQIEEVDFRFPGTDALEVETQKKRGFLGNVKFFLGEGIVKPVAQGIELIPAGVEGVLQVALDGVRNVASKQLAEDGAVFGVSEEQFKARTPEQQRRIDLNNKILTRMDQAVDTSKKLQDKWVEATQTGREASSKDFLSSSPIPFSKNFSMTRMMALGFQSVPMLGMAAAVTASTKSPIAGASVIGVIQAAEEYNVGIDKGLTTKKAQGMFVANALMLSVLESVPLTSFMKGGKILPRMFRTAVQEGGEEVLQQVWVNSVAKIGYDDTRKITEGMAENFIGGFISGGIVGGFGPGDQYAKLMKEAKDKGVDTDTMQEAVAGQIIENADTITESFLSKASPEALVGEEGFNPQRTLARPVEIKDVPIIEKAKTIASEALPQRETVGITAVEKEFLDPVVKKSEGLPPHVLASIDDKFSKIEKNFVREEPKTKARIKTLQKQLQDFIKSSGLELKDKGKFLSAIKDVQTFQQLERKLPAVRERINYLKEASDLRREVSRYKKLTQASVLGKTRAEYQIAIKKVIKNLTPTRVSVPKAMALESLSEFLKQEPDSIIPQHKLDELVTLDKKSLRDMTSSEVKTINDAISHLYKLNALKSSILQKNKYVSLDKTVGEIINNVRVANEGRVSPKAVTGLETTKTKGQAVKNFFGIDSIDPETNLLRVEGKDGGRFQDVVFGGLNRAKTEYLRYYYAAQGMLQQGVKGIDVSSWSQYITTNPKKLKMIPFTFTTQQGTREIELTKAQAVSFHLLMQREEGRSHILNGGFSIRGNLSDVVRVSPEDAQKVSEAVLKDPEMSKVAENLHAFFNGFQKEAINSTSLRLTGLQIADTPNYFRIKVNDLFRKTEPPKKRYPGGIAIEGMGFLQQTVPSKIPLILEDAFQVAYESLHLAGSYVAYAEPLRAAKEVLNSRPLKQTMVKYGREEYLRSFEKYVQRVEGEVTDMSHLEALSKDLLVKIQTSILMLNPGIIAKQPVSLVMAGTEIKGKHLAKSVRLVTTKNEVEELRRFSPQLFARREGYVMRELGELKNTHGIAELFSGKRGFTEKFKDAYSRSDGLAITAIWRAVKLEVAEQFPNLEGVKFFEKVAERAELVVRRTQPTFFVEHRSENLASRKVWQRMVTMFSSATNKQFSMVTRAIEGYNKSGKTFADGRELVKKLATITLMNSILIAMVNLGKNFWLQSSRLMGDDDEVEEAQERIASKFIADVITGPLGMVYGVRDLANLIQSKMVYGRLTHEINNPIGSTFTKLGSGLGDILKSGAQGVSGEEYVRSGEKKWKKSLQKGVTQTVEAVAALKGIPVSNVFRWGNPLFEQVEKLFGAE